LLQLNETCNLEQIYQINKINTNIEKQDWTNNKLRKLTIISKQKTTDVDLNFTTEIMKLKRKLNYK